VSAVPIRVRLTAAFALAMTVVLAGTAVFVYLQLREDLNDTIDGTLRTRATTVAAGEPEETLTQLLARDGRVLTGPPQPVLSAAELRRASAGEIIVERGVPGVEGTARMLARPAGANVVVVGQSLDDRDETLAALVTAFAIGGPVAVLLASLLGWLLSGRAMAPVEAMRRRAADVSLQADDDRLPLPAAHDEIRRLGETLNDMLDRLRGSYARERRFVADASHEMRTPIAVVKAELEAGLRAPDCGPRTRAALVAAVAECDRLAQLADDLLVIARAGEGGLPVRLEAQPARAVLAGVRDRFADRAAELGRAIRIEAPEGLTVWADPLRMRQALGNLVDNALRHGAGEIVLAARPAEGGAEILVTDSGPGFAGLGERAFERFTRGAEARTGGGAGLGLAIVRTIAEAHGGTASLAPGEGAAVRLWLPSQGDLMRAA
jgi:signal transduction histidine kinase